MCLHWSNIGKPTLVKISSVVMDAQALHFLHGALIKKSTYCSKKVIYGENVRVVHNVKPAFTYWYQRHSTYVLTGCPELNLWEIFGCPNGDFKHLLVKIGLMVLEARRVHIFSVPFNQNNPGYPEKCFCRKLLGIPNGNFKQSFVKKAQKLHCVPNKQKPIGRKLVRTCNQCKLVQCIWSSS